MMEVKALLSFMLVVIIFCISGILEEKRRTKWHIEDEEGDVVLDGEDCQDVGDDGELVIECNEM